MSSSKSLRNWGFGAVAVGMGLTFFIFEDLQELLDYLFGRGRRRRGYWSKKRFKNDDDQYPNIVEICLSDIQSAEIAMLGGANSIELCSNRGEGGVTPSVGLINEIVALSRDHNVQIHVLIRPRPGDFVYTKAEFDVMVRDVKAARHAGADGIVVGILLPNGDVDEERMTILRRLSSGMRLTFHRAFDVCRDYKVALGSIVKLGCDRLLTSGLHQTALEGLLELKAIMSEAEVQSSGLEIVAASGVTAENAAEIIFKSGGVHGVHAGSSVCVPLFYEQQVALSSGRNQVTMGKPFSAVPASSTAPSSSSAGATAAADAAAAATAASGSAGVSEAKVRQLVSVCRDGWARLEASPEADRSSSSPAGGGGSVKPQPESQSVQGGRGTQTKPTAAIASSTAAASIPTTTSSGGMMSEEDSFVHISRDGSPGPSAKSSTPRRQTKPRGGFFF